jgi:hypothetical protein
MVMQTGYFDYSGFRQTLLPQSQADFMWPKRHCSRQEAPPGAKPEVDFSDAQDRNL